MAISIEDRYHTLASLLIGEALVLHANLRQRGAVPGPELAQVREKLCQASAALDGVAFTPAVDPQHASKGN